MKCNFHVSAIFFLPFISSNFIWQIPHFHYDYDPWAQLNYNNFFIFTRILHNIIKKVKEVWHETGIKEELSRENNFHRHFIRVKVNSTIPYIKQLIPSVVIGDIPPEYNTIFSITHFFNVRLMLLHLGISLFLHQKLESLKISCSLDKA